MTKAAEMIRRREALRQLLRGHSDELGINLGAILDALGKDLIALVGTETNATGHAVTSPETLKSIIDAIDRMIVGAMRTEAGPAYRDAYRGMKDTLEAGLPRVYGVFGRTTENRVRGGFAVFDEAARSRLFPAGFQDWMGTLQRISADLHSDMQGALSNAMLNGWDRTTFANHLMRLPSFGWSNLPEIGPRGAAIFSHGGALGEASALRRRAHVIARTKLTAARNQAQDTWAQAVGFDRFININADPVSPLCRGANGEPPLTRDEWEATEWGWAPRHPNCDSDMLAVPTEHEDDTARAIAEEYAALQAA